MKLTREQKLKKILDIANQVEQAGAGFFSRHGKDIIINFRGSHGNDPNQWINARSVQDALGVYGTEIIPDAMSGLLYIKIENVYFN